MSKSPVVSVRDAAGKYGPERETSGWVRGDGQSVIVGRDGEVLPLNEGVAEQKLMIGQIAMALFRKVFSGWIENGPF
jgi:hypothetical protein